VDAGKLSSTPSTGVDRLIGETVGNYRVHSRIGQGGMGAVYLCVHNVLGRKAALKVLLPEYSNNAELVGRFFNEARATAQLRHPAFVGVFDSGTRPDGSAYLVMEYLEGENLGSRIDRRGSVSLGDCLAITRDVAEGVDFAHRHGIVHRDLKPDNIFLAVDTEAESTSPRLVIKVLDFGIAKLTAPDREGSARTRTGLLLGTPLFMSPEQCRGAGTVDHRSDIYAIGCIVHTMLAGSAPFPLEGFGEIIAAHMGQPPPPLRSLAPKVPAVVESLVLQMLAKRPEQRPSMAAVIAEVDRIRAQLPEAERSLTLISPSMTASAPRTGGAATPGTLPAGAGTDMPRAGSPISSPGGTRLLPTPTTLQGTASEIKQAGTTANVARGRRGKPAIVVASVGALAGAAFVIVRLIGGGVQPPVEPGSSAGAGSATQTTARDEPAAPAARRAAPPETSTIKLTGVPAGAVVWLDGRRATPPLTVARGPQPHQLTIEAEGYQSKDLSIDGESNQTVAIELKKAIAPTAAAPPSPSSSTRTKRRNERHHAAPGFSGFTDL
jgi:serine/threonine protein kinase